MAWEHFTEPLQPGSILRRAVVDELKDAVKERIFATYQQSDHDDDYWEDNRHLNWDRLLLKTTNAQGFVERTFHVCIVISDPSPGEQLSSETASQLGRWMVPEEDGTYTRLSPVGGISGIIMAATTATGWTIEERDQVLVSAFRGTSADYYNYIQDGINRMRWLQTLIYFAFQGSRRQGSDASDWDNAADDWFDAGVQVNSQRQNQAIGRINSLGEVLAETTGAPLIHRVRPEEFWPGAVMRLVHKEEVTSTNDEPVKHVRVSGDLQVRNAANTVVVSKSVPLDIAAIGIMEWSPPTDVDGAVDWQFENSIHRGTNESNPEILVMEPDVESGAHNVGFSFGVNNLIALIDFEKVPED